MTQEQMNFWLALTDRLIPLIQALIGLLTPLVVALAAYITWKTRQEVKETKHQVEHAREEVEVVRREVNGKMSSLLEQTSKASHAEGVAEGVAAAVQNVNPPKVEVHLAPSDSLPGGKRRSDPPARAPDSENRTPV